MQLISVSILLMYRSENSKLKYVLEVVNFFGRSDSVTMVRLEQGVNTEFPTKHIFDDPAPMWTRLGDFHAYSSHWHKNDFSAGGEVVTIVVGLQRSPVKFRCSLIYPGGTNLSSNTVTGLFSYVRAELPSTMTKDAEHYHVYRFMCKVNKDFGLKGPRIVVLHDIQMGSADHFMHINNLSQSHTTVEGTPKGQKSMATTAKKVTNRSSVTACIDFIPYNITKSAASQSNLFTDKEILEFFLHHSIVGIQEFIVYEMNNLPSRVHELLQHQGIHITKLPFNFPYELGDALKIRGILEMDCLLRTSAHFKYVLITRLNEFFLPTSNVRLNRSFVQSLEVHPDNINRFELPMQTICMPEEEGAGNRIRSGLHMFDANARNKHPVAVYRPGRYELIDEIKSIELSQSSGIVHRFSRHCPNSVNLKDWRETVNAEHLHFITEVEKELKGLLI